MSLKLPKYQIHNKEYKEQIFNLAFAYPYSIIAGERYLNHLKGFGINPKEEEEEEKKIIF